MQFDAQKEISSLELFSPDTTGTPGRELLQEKQAPEADADLHPREGSDRASQSAAGRVRDRPVHHAAIRQRRLRSHCLLQV